MKRLLKVSVKPNIFLLWNIRQQLTNSPLENRYATIPGGALQESGHLELPHIIL